MNVFIDNPSMYALEHVKRINQMVGFYVVILVKFKIIIQLSVFFIQGG